MLFIITRMQDMHALDKVYFPLFTSYYYTPSFHHQNSRTVEIFIIATIIINHIYTRHQKQKSLGSAVLMEQMRLQKLLFKRS